MKKILYVCGHDRFFYTHYLHLAQQCLKKGWQVHLACPFDQSHYYRELISQAGVILHHIPLSRAGINPLEDLKTLWAMHRLFRNLKPNTVHNLAMKPIIYGSMAAQLARVPRIVNTATGLGYTFTDTTLKAQALKTILTLLMQLGLNHKNSHIIVENPDDLAIMTQLTAKAHHHLIPGAGADTDYFLPTPEPKIPPFKLLCVSRLLYSKGIQELIEAVSMVVDNPNMPQIHLDIVGGQDQHNPQNIPEYVINNWHNSFSWLTFHGHQDDLRPYYHQCHVVVLPSHREGLPKALLDGACSGRPMVATNVPGCNTIVKDNSNGLLVPKGDISAISQAIITLISDAELRKRLGEQARIDAQTLYSREHISLLTLELY